MKKIFAIAFVCSAFLASAQQDIQFTQFMYNRLYYNPAVAGAGDAICATAVHRSQWVGFDGAPTSQNVNASVPLKILRGGLGLNIVNDQIGFFRNVNAGLSYAYKHQLNNGVITAGVGFNIFTKSVENAGWVVPEPQDIGNDIALPAENNNNTAYFDMDFGFYYESDRLWAGISATRLLNTAAELDPYNKSISSFTLFTNQRHYNIMGGYNIPLAGTMWELQPNVLVKTDFVASPVADVNITGVYNNQFWGGVSYRTGSPAAEAVAANIGYQFTESLRAGYSYDVAISDISQQGGGSHEVFLKYCFKVEIPPREKGSYRNVRFL